MVVPSSWSVPQSGVTTELDVGEVSNCIDMRRRRDLVPRVQPRPHNGSDQQVPVYWDQTVPVWEASRSSSKRKAPDVSLCCRYGNRFRAFEGVAAGATILTADETLLERSRSEHGRESFAASEELGVRNSPASLCSSPRCEACNHQWRGSRTSDGDLDHCRSRCNSHDMSLQSQLQYHRDPRYETPMAPRDGITKGLPDCSAFARTGSNAILLV